MPLSLRRPPVSLSLARNVSSSSSLLLSIAFMPALFLFRSFSPYHPLDTEDNNGDGKGKREREGGKARWG